MENAATALAVLEKLMEMGWKLDLENIQRGFAQTSWPGRFEILSKEPLVIIDSAHNLDSAEKLVQTIRDYLNGRPLTLIFGASEDKDVTGMFNVLAPVSDRVILTQSVHPRSYDAVQLGEIGKEIFAKMDVIPKLELALEHAGDTIPQNGVILITGSIFVAAGARQYFLDKTSH